MVWELDVPGSSQNITRLICNTTSIKRSLKPARSQGSRGQKEGWPLCQQHLFSLAGWKGLDGTWEFDCQVTLLALEKSEDFKLELANQLEKK